MNEDAWFLVIFFGTAAILLTCLLPLLKRLFP